MNRKEFENLEKRMMAYPLLEKINDKNENDDNGNRKEKAEKKRKKDE